MIIVDVSISTCFRFIAFNRTEIVFVRVRVKINVYKCHIATAHASQ